VQAILALEDGAIFTGEAFGATGEQWGEVVFNTSMTGYQEVLTDPSYCGQIVVMTYPLIGNYGINKEDFEAKRSFVRGFIVREICDRPSNWRVSCTVSDFLAKENIIGLAGVDTRALTRHLRSHGTMRGIICTGEADIKELVNKAANSPDLSEQEMISVVSTRESYTLPGSGPRVVLMDLGSKSNIANCLNKRGCEVIIVPHDTRPEDILALNPDGMMLSNGPGDPVMVPHGIENTRALLNKLPIFGICLGHQVVALALGAKTYKLKFGHRGANHPVKDLHKGKVNITSQNHGFAVDEASLNGLDVYVSHRNLNDNTVEGIAHKHLPLFTVQYHPEASPGPMESAYLFDEFIARLKQEV
jgi:carbamoyl-phosphate synthase small subunit